MLPDSTPWSNYSEDFNNTQTKEAEYTYSMICCFAAVGFNISIFFLQLHLLVPDLSAFPTGKFFSTAFLKAIFFGCFFFALGNSSTLSKVYCTTLAVTILYFLLVSFFWLNTISYDVWRTLRLATQGLRVSSGNQWKRFLGYSLYAWGVPTAGLVTSVVVIDNIGSVPSDFKPGFGAGVALCWFSKINPLLIFFASPIIAVLIVNIGFLISSSKMSSSLYLRLSVVIRCCELICIFCVIGGNREYVALQLAFSIFYVMQYLVVFVTFTFEGFLCECYIWEAFTKYLLVRFKSISRADKLPEHPDRWHLLHLHPNAG